ncbi:MAG: hypothetical protein V4710_16625 [Verrucomicrobiota bacterium]
MSPRDWMKFLALPLMAMSVMADEAADWSVHGDLQIVSVRLDNSLGLVPDLRHQATFAAAYDRLQTMIEKNEATLLA